MKVTIEIELTEEDLRAGEYAFTHKFDTNMSLEDMVRWHLEPAARAYLHKLRSKLKWARDKIYEHPNLRQVEIGGKQFPVGVGVVEPREGTQQCSGSPTQACWYDNRKDPAWDFCLFCGEPHERK